MADVHCCAKWVAHIRANYHMAPERPVCKEWCGDSTTCPVITPLLPDGGPGPCKWDEWKPGRDVA